MIFFLILLTKIQSNLGASARVSRLLRESIMKHINNARLARDIARKQFALEEARRERWILTGMIVAGLCTAFLISVMVQVIKSS